MTLLPRPLLRRIKRLLLRSISEPLRRAFAALMLRFGLVHLWPSNRTERDALLHALRPVRTQFPLIRLGSLGDGGYLVPDDLAGIAACFSPGVGTISSFEEDCAHRGMRVYLADGSVTAPAAAHVSFEFIAKHIGIVDTATTMMMDTWMSTVSASDSSDLILQMDIEGAEWLALANIAVDRLRQFRIIVVELHDVDLLLHEKFFSLRAQVLRRLLDEFVCVHLHPNNCCGSITRKGATLPRVMEMTLLRKDRAEVIGQCEDFPHPLDIDNTSRPTLTLPSPLGFAARQSHT
ncbi:MAG: hypothetical protein ACKOI2_05410 [Actinomycetota bacterium]